MIEAVNSVLSNASASRQIVEQQSTARSNAANPTKIQEAATTTPYISPYISLDRSSNRAVLQIRDSDTGDVLRQYPTKTQLRAYQNAQEYSQRLERAETVGPSESQGASLTSQATRAETPQVSEVSQPQQQAQPQQNLFKQKLNFIGLNYLVIRHLLKMPFLCRLIGRLEDFSCDSESVSVF